jgi:hypothetical protein
MQMCTGDAPPTRSNFRTASGPAQTRVWWARWPWIIDVVIYIFKLYTAPDDRHMDLVQIIILIHENYLHAQASYINYSSSVKCTCNIAQRIVPWNGRPWSIGPCTLSPILLNRSLSIANCSEMIGQVIILDFNGRTFKVEAEQLFLHVWWWGVSVWVYIYAYV